DALVGDVIVTHNRLGDIVERIGHTGTTGILDPHAHPNHGLVAILNDFLDPLGRTIGERHDLKSHFYHQFSATCASSLILSGPQGGSNTIVTSTSWMPSTERAAFSTHPGISPATGHPGAVSVISMLTLRSSSRSTL